MFGGTGLKELDDFCKKEGIPLDRVNLVRRNLELKEHIKEYREVAELLLGLLHDAQHHRGTYKDCEEKTCMFIANIVKELGKLS